jgi:hypothetical protein
MHILGVIGGVRDARTTGTVKAGLPRARTQGKRGHAAQRPAPVRATCWLSATTRLWAVSRALKQRFFSWIYAGNAVCCR